MGWVGCRIGPRNAPRHHYASGLEGVELRRDFIFPLQADRQAGGRAGQAGWSLAKKTPIFCVKLCYLFVSHGFLCPPQIMQTYVEAMLNAGTPRAAAAPASVAPSGGGARALVGRDLGAARVGLRGCGISRNQQRPCPNGVVWSLLT